MFAAILAVAHRLSKVHPKLVDPSPAVSAHCGYADLQTYTSSCHRDRGGRGRTAGGQRGRLLGLCRLGCPRQQTGYEISPTGIAPNAIKHVWLIILENKSYDATFTGLNQNTYLWKTLPAQGALLTHYYGTGHSSMDNYLSMVSGQAPVRGRAGGLLAPTTP